jgi:penicillin-binding protein 1A
MTQALQDRPEQIPAMPEGLAHDGDDYVYSEYLQGKCMEESSPFVRSRYQCTAAQLRALAKVKTEAETKILSAQSDANERARIIEMFSARL